MITEDYVSYEVAKLLKEKGFDECPLFRYDDCGELWVQGGYNKTIKWHFPAPTLQMAMKWLREVHKLYIEITPSSRTNEFIVDSYRIDIVTKTFDTIYVNSGYDTYEQACEAAIKYCLENLI